MKKFKAKSSRTRVLFATGLAIICSVSLALAAVIDAPHNETNNVTCSSCHTYSLWWKYSPTTQDQVQGHTEIVNTVCLTCHDNGGPATLAKTHSSAMMGITSAYHGGSWGVGCTDCHSPHFQEQLDWRPNSYLIEGVLDENTTTAGVDNSTIVISNLTKQDDVNWPTTNWPNLIFALDAASPSNTYSVISATATEIVVKGQIDLSALAPNVDPDGYGPRPVNSATANTFGLFYGQLLKSNVASKKVKFFDPTGGFVDEETAGADFPTGICQVCHVEAKHYGFNPSATSDNYLPVPGQGDSHEGRNASNCMECHSHPSGFKPTGGDHPITLGSDQVDCGTLQSCSVCHSDYDQVNGTALGLSNWETILWEHDADGVKDGSNACTTCHDSLRQVVIDVIAAQTGNSTCVDCHADRTICHVNDHVTPQWVMDGVSSCTANCHTAMFANGRVNIVASDPKVHNSCTSCHPGTEAPVSLIGSASGKSVLLGQSTANNCDTCHGTSIIGRGGIHEQTASSHVGQVWATTDGTCETCHSDYAAAAGSADNGHPGCTTCHEGGTYVLVGSAVNGAGDCKDCHGLYFTSHTHHTANNRVSFDTGLDKTLGGTNCNTCHGVDGVDVGATALDSWDEIYALHFNSCDTCHSYTNADGLGTPPLPLPIPSGGSPVTCASCHTPKASTQHGGHLATDWEFGASGCDTCHNQAYYVTAGVPEVVLDIHKNNCALCHLDPGNNDFSRKSGTDGDATTMVGRTGDCLDCHAATKPFMHHATAGTSYTPTTDCVLCHNMTNNSAGNHLTLVIDVTPCLSCHTDTAPVDINNVPLNSGTDRTANLVHDACISCHVITPVTNIVDTIDPVSSALVTTMNNPDGAAATNNGGGTCSTCHTAYFDGHGHDHSISQVLNDTGSTPSTDCDGCHSAVSSPFVGVDEVHTLNGCLTCHNNIDGGLIPPAVTGGGECATCHTAYFDGHSHVHNVGVFGNLSEDDTGAPLACTHCHTIMTDWAGIAAGHLTCIRCHDATRDVNITNPTGTTTVQDVIRAGASQTDCFACHPDRNVFHGSTYIDHNTGPATLFVTPTASCVSCHTGPDYVQDTHNGTCSSCHEFINQVLSLATWDTRNYVTAIAPGECITCHSTYFDAHVHGTGSVHYVSAGTDASAGYTCVTCHSGQVETWSNILTKHNVLGNGGCATCHESPRTTDVGAGFTSVVDVIVQGGSTKPITCLDCHASRSTRHVVDHNVSGFVNTETLCSTSCHQGPVLEVVHLTNRCTTCHDQTQAPVVLKSIAAGHADQDPGFGNPNTCTTCHTNSFAGHSHTHVLNSVPLCTNCHTATTAPFVGTGEIHETNGCNTCHDTANDGLLKGSAAGKGSGSNCVDCHTGYFDNHGHTHGLTTVSLCNGCHVATATPFVGAGEAHETNGCSTCHDTATNGALSGSAAGAAANADCQACHTTYFDGHSHGHATSVTVPVAATGRQLCTTCHTANFTPFIGTGEIHETIGCTTCHDTATNGALKGSAFGVTNGGECVVCHTNHFDGHDHGTTGGNIDHFVDAGADQSNGTPCGDCHTGQTTTWTEILNKHNVAANGGCVTCHESTRTINVGAGFNSIADVIVLGGSSHPITCLDCHADKSAHHETNHTLKGFVTTETLCSTTCHQGSGLDSTHTTNGCRTCHDQTQPPVVLKSIAAGHADQDPGFGNPNTCTTCHTNSFAGHTHVHVLNSVALCVNCHTATTAPFVDAGQAHAASSCSTCHDTANDGVLKGSAAGKGSGSNCVDCHTGYFDNHGHSHGLASVTLCNGCHVATASPFIGAGEAHQTNGCTTCHNTATNGALSGSAAGAAANADCQGCHATYFDGHSHGHAASVTVPVAATGRQLCTTCHTANFAPFIGTNEIHELNGCTTCHDTTTNGALIGSAFGVTNGGECVTCHTNHFDGHDHGTTGGNIDHFVSAGTDLSNGTPCGDCHSGQTSTWTEILTKHTILANGGCVTCHESARTINVGAGYSSIADVIVQGGSANPITCLDCHSNKSVHHETNHTLNGFVTTESLCSTTCHQGSGLDSVHQTNACHTCHDQTQPPVVLKSIAAGHADQDPGFGNPNTCTTCHTNGFTGHSHVHVLNSVPLCTNCHTAMTAPFVDAGQAHAASSCSTCHDTANDGVLKGSAAGKVSGSNCVDCHNGYFDNHGHSHALTTVALCEGCHVATASPFVGAGEAHAASSCSTCHDTATNGALSGSATGAAANADCQACHTTYFNGHSHGHAASVTVPVAATGRQLCTTCHTANFTPFIGTNEIHELNGCTTCHDTATNGALKGSAFGVSNGGECVTCHTTHFDGHDHGTTGGKIDHSVSAGTDQSNGTPCGDCHTGQTGTWTEILNKHNILANGGCVTCHDSARTINVGAGFSSIGDVIVQGGAANPITCLDCHADKSAHHETNHTLNGFVTTETLCSTTCHQGSGLDSVHQTNACHTCHDQTQPPVVLKSLAAGHADQDPGFGNPNTCTTCHTNGFTGHSHVHVLNSVPLCTNCHTAMTAPFVDAGQAHATSSCSTCHDTANDGVLKGSAAGKASGSNCVDCHTGYFDNHGHSHGLTSVSLCNGCHVATASPFVGAGEAHETNSCSTCHDTVTNGALTGSATGAAANANCQACHTLYFDGHGHNHATSVTTPVGKVGRQLCTNCHTAATSPFVGAGEAHATKSCTTCHDTATNGALKGSAFGVINGGECVTCHTTHFDGHDHGTTGGNIDHSVSAGTDQSNGKPCGDCHTNQTGTWTEILNKHNVAANGGCVTCHDSARTINVGVGYSSIADVIVQGGAANPITCLDCHADKSAHHETNHTLNGFVTTESLCSTTCHQGSGLDGIHQTNGCTTCHDQTQPPVVLKSIAAGHADQDTGFGNPNTCTTCHTNSFAGHSHVHVLDTVSLCLNCHTATTSPFIGASEAHETNGCTTCHDTTTNGVLKGSAAGKAAGSNCVDCHTGYFDNHGHSHGLTSVTLCNGCHVATASPFVGTGEAHAASSCSTCHDTATNGALTGSATGAAANANCQTCHTTYFDGHSHNHTTSVTTPVGKVGRQLCTNCHTATTAPFVGAGEAHATKNCTTCHDTATNGALKGSAFGVTNGGECVTCHTTHFDGHDHGTTGGNIDHSVSAGTDQSNGKPCGDCHTNQTSTWTEILNKHNVASNGGCVTCHDSARTVNVGAGFSSIADVIVQGGAANPITCLDCHADKSAHHETNHTLNGFVTTEPLCSTTCHQGSGLDGIHQTNGCTTCHDQTQPPVVLKSIASGHADQDPGFGNPNTCTTCHTSSFAGHSHVHVLNTVSLCTNCHTASAAPYTGAGQAHAASSCSTCHDTVNDGVLKGSAAGKASGSNCTDCHSGYFDNHGHSHGLTSVTLCNGCHVATAAPFVGAGEAHNASSCATCHDTATNGALAGSATGAAANANCQACHTSYFDGHGHDHTTSVTTPVGKVGRQLCTNCHTATASPFIGAGEVHDLNNCTTCHDTATNGALKGSALGVTNGGECVTCHTTHFDGHDHGTTGGNIDHSVSAGLDQSAGQPCVSCHTNQVENWTNILSRHNVLSNGGCETCHDSARVINVGAGYASVADVIVQGGIANPITCLDCHADRSTAHGSNADHSAAGLGHVTDTALCVSCHAAGDPMLVHNNTCTLCHTTPPTLASVEQRSFVSAISRGECVHCHSQYYNAHTHNHTATVAATSLCVNCHLGDRVTSVHTSCQSCHSAVDGSRRVGTYGDATANNGAGGECITCHSGYFESHTHDHSTDVMANYATTPIINNCVGCHDQADLTVGIHSTKGCATCHNMTTGNLEGSAGLGGGQCVNCHTNYFVGHDHGTDGVGAADHVIAFDPLTDLAQTTSRPCSDCHANIADFTGILALHTSCGLCHDATRDVNPFVATGTTVQDIIRLSTGTVNCLDCHENRRAPTGHGVDHSILGSGQITDVPLCVSCHTANSPLKVHKENCQACHTATPPNLELAANRNYVTAIGQGNCTFCHSTYFNSHTHDHSGSIAGVALCNNCHSGDAINGLNTHKGNCFNCHSSVNGARIIGANGYGDATVNSGNGGNCSDCHSLYFNGHSHNHGLQVVADPACVTCHNEADLVTGIHDISGCQTCHESATGLLKAVLPAGGGICTDCHGSHDTDLAHNNRTIDFGTGISCSICHTSDSAILGNPGSGTLTSHADIDALHSRQTGDGCALCHLYDAASQSNSEGLPLQSTVDNAIINGQGSGTTTASCVDCHDYNQVSHPDYVDHVGFGVISWTAACARCHDNDHANPADVVVDVHKNICSSCHTANIPTLENAGNRNYVVNIAQGDCETCHGLDYMHANATHSKIIFGDDGQGNTDCFRCHSSDPLVEHVTNRGFVCSVCHQASCYDTVIDAAIAAPAAQVFCTDCHNDQTFPHGNHTHKIGGISNCVVCHTETNVIEGIHVPGLISGANTCDTCHASAVPEVSGTILGGGGDCASCHTAYYQHNVVGNHTISTIAPCNTCHTATTATFPEIVALHRDTCATCHGSSDPTVVSVIATGGAVDCSSCHGALATVHHAGANADAGNCEYCHADPRTPQTAGPWDAVGPGENGTNSGLNVPTQLGCADCHVSFDGTNMTVTKFTRTDYESFATPWTTAAIHTIPTTATRINNYGICFSCHDDDTSDNAPMVTVWHARPDQHDPAGGNNWSITSAAHASRSSCYADTAHNAAGRAVDDGSANRSSNVGRFNLFYADYTAGSAQKPRPAGNNGSTRCDTENDRYDTSNTGVPAFITTISVPSVPGNGNTGGNVPVFASLVPNGAGGGGGGDKITVTQAYWTEVAAGSGDLVIHATSSSQALVTLSYSGSNFVQVGTHYELTLFDVTNPGTVVVTSSGGGSSADTVVLDRTCTTCASGQTGAANHPNYDNLPTTGNCANCHYGKLDAEHRAQGIGCTSCHGGAGNICVPQSITDVINLGITNPDAVNCYSCHGAVDHYAVHDNIAFDDHGVDCTICHEGNVVSDHVDLHGFSCTTCHNAGTYDAVIASGMAGSTVVCTDCHNATNGIPYIANHWVWDHVGDGYVRGSANCTTCHSGAVILDVHSTNRCATCHTGLVAPVTLVGSAAGHAGATPATPNDCETCHGVNPYHDTVDPDLYHDKLSPTPVCTNCHGGGTAAQVPDIDQLDDFAGLANGDRPIFGNWTGVASSEGLIGWTALSGSTGSSSTGPATGNPGPYVYLESSSSGQTYAVGVSAGSENYIESNVFDASVYSLSFDFDWNMNVNNNTDASLHVDAWNGTSWDLDVPGSAINIGNAGDVWNNSGTIDLAAYANIDFKIRIRYIVGTGTNYQNDVAVDNLHILGIPKVTGLDIYQLHRAGDCTTCHAYDGSGVVDLQAATSTIAAGISGTRVYCVNCHVDFWFDNHVWNHTGVTGTALCQNCHTGNTTLPVHTDCYSCHDHATAERISGPYGDATLDYGLGAGMGGSCADCHSAYFDGHAHDHSTNVQANSAVNLPSSNCVNCHNQADRVSGIHTASCAACHNATDGSLIGSAVPGGGECITCHTAYFDGHGHVHSIQISGTDLGQPDSQPCSNCHVVGTWADILDTHKKCERCHDSERDINKSNPTGTTIQWIIENSASADCLTCHIEKQTPAEHHATDHSASGVGHILDAPMCINCHIANNPLANHNNHCSNCHTSPPSLQSAASRNYVTVITRGTCETCHTQYFNDHLHDHNATLTSTAFCGSCHTGDMISEIHADNCDNCHSPVTGALINGSKGWGTAMVNSGNGGTCEECHPNYFDAHTHDHSSDVMANTLTTPHRSDCTHCHNDGDPITRMHQVSGCASCHSMTDNSLVGSAAGGGGECVTCHTGYYNAHSHTHTLELGVGDLAQSDYQPCSNCHGGPDQLITDFAEIKAIHLNDCATCHDAEREVNVSNPNGFTVQLVIDSGSNSSTIHCLTCHEDRVAPTIHQAVDHSEFGTNHLLRETMCSNCHTEVDPLDTHNRVCSRCHTAPPFLQQAVNRNYVTNIAGGTCSTCHTAYFNAHTHDHAAQVTAAAECVTCHSEADLVMELHSTNGCLTCHDAGSGLLNAGLPAGGGDCNACHAPHNSSVVHNFRSISFGSGTTCSGCHTGDSGVLGDPGIGTLATQDDVDALHSRITGDPCTLCHLYDYATQQNHAGLPSQATVDGAIAQGMSGTTDATCVVCHGYNQTDHPDVDHVTLKYVTASANCVSCHSDPDMQVGIHKTNGCYTCHSDTVSPVTLIGSATDQYVPETNVANTCETCHGVYPYHPDQDADHNMMGVTASCLTCHDVSGPPAPPIDQVDDFVGLANGTRPNFGNWTGVASSEGLIGWTALSGATGSGTTGPAAGNPDPYIYLESSASGQNYAVGVTAGSQNYIESNVFDASVYSISFTFDWNMNVNNNTTASLHVDAWNGTAWDLDVSGAAINTGNAGDVWNTSGPIDLSAYQNADFKIRIRYIVGTGTIYQNDVAVDNLVISAVSRVTGPDVFAIHLNNCQMCHAYDGSGNTLPSAVTDSINIGSGPSGLAVECTSCHAGYFKDHAHDHNLTVAATTLCVSCHTGDRITTVHLDCTSCHNTTDGTRIVGVNGYGDATVNGGAGGTCQECHSSYFAAHIHHNSSNEVQANTATTPVTDNCTGCHTQGITLDGTGIHVGLGLDGCSACHNQSNGILRYPAVAGGGECIACHASGFAAHGHVHNIAQEAGDIIPTGSAACSACHAVATWNDIRDTHYECGVCHNAARFVDESAGSGSTIQDVINTYTSGNVACLGCHVEKGTLPTHGFVDHSPAGNNTITDTSLCINCHAANNPVAAHGDRCSSCHTSPPVLQVGGATVTVMSQGECITCHTASFNLHSHDHSLTVTPTAACISCHQEADIIGGVHGMNGCANCHSATTGELIVAANGDATVNFLTGGACDECHATYFATHTHDHTLTVKANTATYPPDMPSTDCVHCHTEADLVSGVHFNGCTTCHDTSAGVLVGSAFGNDSGGECVTCHATGFAVHSNHSHEMREGVTDLGQVDGQPCANCHGGADKTFLNTIEIKNLHHGDCLLCHDSDRDINPVSPTGTTVQDVIDITGRLINCLDCHQDKLTPASHGYVNHGQSGFQHILDTPFCVNCHLADDPMGVHGSLCSRCHTAPPALQDPANRPRVTVIASNECIGCHTAGFEVHTHDHSTEVALHADCVTCHNSDPIAGIHGVRGCATCHNQVTGALEPPAVAGGGTCLACHPAKNTETDHNMRSISFGDGPDCSMCHTSDFSVLGQPGLGQLVTMADVDSLHSRVTGDDCTLCHLYDAATQSNPEGLPLQATVESAIADGAAGLRDITCAVCHDYNQSAHPIDHVTNQFITASAACVGCHNESDLVIGIHKTNKCSTCHLGTIPPVTLAGSAAGHRVPEDVAANSCESCHGTDPYHPTDHRQHDMMVPTASCVASCHDVTGTPAPPINQMDDFAGLANGTRPNFGNWTGVAGSDATNGWVILSGSTASGTTGPGQGNPDPYIYLESSATSQTYGVGVTAGSSQYVESNVIDASVYTVTFAFEWNMNVNNNTDASLHVDAWNGTVWDLDITGAAINTGNNGDIWVSQAAIDLSAYSNADFKVRIRYIVGTGTNYQNDVAIDNLSLNMTARAVAPDIIGLHLNDCQKCHTYGGTGYTPLQDVVNAINNGSSSAASPASQECVSCHSIPRYQADPHTP